MQLYVQGLSTHVLNFESTETVAEIKDRVAVLEKLRTDEINLYVESVPISEADSLASNFEKMHIEMTVGLKGGKVHGSLARAGKVRGQTPKVEKQEKRKKKTGRAKKRMLYNKRILNPQPTYGHGPNHNGGGNH